MIYIVKYMYIEPLGSPLLYSHPKNQQLILPSDASHNDFIAMITGTLEMQHQHRTLKGVW